MQLLAADGTGPTFVRSESGAYVPGLADGSVVQYALGGTLLRVGEGAWTYTAPDGSLTEFTGGRVSAEWLAGIPLAGFTWDGEGRLVTLTDGVTGGRAFSLSYGDGCAASGWSEQGFSAGDGLWCSVTYPDGQTTQAGYVQSGGKQRLALVADPGGVGESYGWDESGRLVSVRSPSVTSAAAVDAAWGDAQYATQVAYDGEGRVASVTLGATAPDAPRVRRAYEYPSGGDLVAQAQQLIVQGGQESPVDSSLGGGIVLRVSADNAWRTMTSTAVDGLTGKVEYDPTTGASIGGTTPQDRRVEVRTDGEGLLRESVGPFSGDASGALRSERTLDVQVEEPERGADSPVKPWQGLASLVWPAGGAGVPGFWDSAVLKEGLAASFDGPPAAGAPAGPWRAQATGLWRVAQSGEYDVEVSSSEAATASVSIDGVRCAGEGSGSSCRMRLAKGEHSVLVTFDVTSADGRGAFAVRAGRDGPAQIEVADLRPNFNMATRVQLNDKASGFDLGDTVSVTDQPWTGQPDKVVTAGGRATTYDYEATDGAAGTFGRMTGLTTPGGSTATIDYYRPDESATDPCTSASYPQAGLPKTSVRYDGVRITTVYDAAGRPVAISTEGPGISELVCTTYDAGGRVLTTQVSNSDKKVIEQTSMSRVVSDGLLTVTSTTTLGEASPVGAGETFVTTNVTNVAGQTVRSQDAAGTRVELTYAPDGTLLERSVWAPGVEGDPTLRMEYAYDPQTGRPTKVTVNGRVLATVSYDGRGQVNQVDYPGGVGLGIAYGSNGAVTTVEVTAGKRTYVSNRSRNPVGRTLASDIAVREGGKVLTSQQWEYSYDEAGRLVKATLVTDGEDADTGGPKRVFGYDYGAVAEGCFAGAPANLDRSGGSRDGTDYQTCRDDKGRLSWTTDPHLTGGEGRAQATYDGLGRLTELTGAVPLRLEFASGTQVSRVAQGDSVATFLYAGGTLQSMTREAGGSTTTVRYGYAGTASPTFVLDGDLAVLDTRVALPGGTLAHLGPDPRAADGDKQLALDFSDAGGAALVTTVGGTPVGDTPAALAPRLGPYGEPLAAAPAAPTGDTSGIGPGTRFGFHAAAGNPTVTGHHDLTLTLRPYHPWLGEFLASDPIVAASTTAYGYGNGDPVDSPDYTGGFGDWDITGVVGAGIAFIAGISMGTAKQGASKVRMVGSAVLGGLGAVTAVVGVAGSWIQGRDNGSSAITTMTASLGLLAFIVGGDSMRGMLMQRAKELKAQQLKQAEDMAHMIDKPWRAKASAIEFPSGAGILIDPGPKVTTLSLYVPTQAEALIVREVGNNSAFVSKRATTQGFIEMGQDAGWIPRGDYTGIEAYIFASM
ncbi:MAG: hypothetical protein ACKOT0_01930 [bacterium]